ncbi:MAG: phosphotriesterase-related protein [Dehalococcoidia bacterium]|nr:phosphotriesterase-related protein [Dehalococcoidia bacterium]
MATVNTVLGPVDPKALGFTLMHEHLVASSAGIPHTFPELLDRRETIAQGVKALQEAAAEGVGTYVDVTTMDLGRDVTVLREVAEQVGVHIITATGIWLDIPRAIANALTPDQLARLFVREIEVGIEGTGIKAGVIKVATSEQGVTPANELVLRAAARASNSTGVPITTHTVATTKVGEAQMAIFQEERVDPRRVCIGHSNSTTDLDYLAGLARQGCVLGMDQYPGGRMGSLNWEERTQVVKRLVDMGLAQHVSFSHDHLITSLMRPEMREERRAYNPDGICFMSRKVLPRLRELGVSESAIRAMTVEAPRRFFGGE